MKSETLTHRASRPFGRTATICAGTVLKNLLGLAIPIAMLQMFQRILPNGSSESLSSLFVILCGVVVLEAVLGAARSRVIVADVANAETRTNTDVIGKIFHADLTKLDRIGSEQLIERVLSIPQLRPDWSAQRLILTLDMAFSVVFLWLIWILAGPLVLVPISMICCVALIARIMRPAQLLAVQRIEKTGQQRMSFLIEVMQNVRLLKLFGAEMRILRKYEALHRKSAAANKILVKNSDIIFTTSALMGQATTGVTSLIGAWLVIGNQIGLAELATAILLTGRCVQPFTAGLFRTTDFHNIRRVGRDIREVLSLPDHAPLARPGDVSPNAMQLHDVIVPSPDTKDIYLEDIAIPRNGITLITGERGGSVQAVLQALAGQSRPKWGEIIFEKTLRGTRPLTCFVPARFDMMPGTIVENLIDFGGRKKIAERVKWTRRLNMSTELSQIPNGLDAEFSGSGRGAGSPGFFRKLHIAAALGRHAHILILESPFLFLDEAATARLEEALIEISADTTLVIFQPSERLRERATQIITLHPDGTATSAPGEAAHSALPSDQNQRLAG